MIWKSCPEYENYEVSECGDVRRADNHAPLRGVRHKHTGYRQYNLSQNGQAKSFIAARLVLMAFVGPAPFDGAETCHNDGTRTNDHYSNLRWDTASGNHHDKVLHGTWVLARGEMHHFSKLSEANVRSLREAASAGVPRKSLCAEYNVSSGRLSDIVNRKSWAHIA